MMGKPGLCQGQDVERATGTIFAGGELFVHSGMGFHCSRESNNRRMRCRDRGYLTSRRIIFAMLEKDGLKILKTWFKTSLCSEALGDSSNPHNLLQSIQWPIKYINSIIG